MAVKIAGEMMISLDQYPHIPYWFTLRQAIAALEKSEIDKDGQKSLPRALLVFDEHYHLLGCVRRRDILRGLEPKFLRTMPITHRKSLFDVDVDPNLVDLSKGKISKALQEQEHEFEVASEDVQKDLKQVFTPEFINRLDSTVVFHPLTKESIEKIVKLQINEFQERLNEKNITLHVESDALKALTKISYHPESGARQVRRVLADKLEHPLAEALLNSSIKSGNVIKVSYNQKKELCEFKVS